MGAKIAPPGGPRWPRPLCGWPSGCPSFVSWRMPGAGHSERPGRPWVLPGRPPPYRFPPACLVSYINSLHESLRRCTNTEFNKSTPLDGIRKTPEKPLLNHQIGLIVYCTIADIDYNKRRQTNPTRKAEIMKTLHAETITTGNRLDGNSIHYRVIQRQSGTVQIFADFPPGQSAGFPEVVFTGTIQEARRQWAGMKQRAKSCS